MTPIKQQSGVREWNAQHALLRRLLEKDKDYRQALPVFLAHHAAVHTAKLAWEKQGSYQDEVLAGLTETQMRSVPPGRPHSAAWALWHITRIEDVTLNLLLANSPQVFSRGNWSDKLEVATASVGNAMSAAEIAELSAALNLKALLAYRLAVGKRTREIVRRLNPALLWDRPAPERLERIVQEGAVGEDERWLLKYWGGHPASNLLLMPATRHAFVHLNEIARMRPRLLRV
ncbi:MAG: DinB family protein [Anaerolineae bacterium]